MPTRQNTIRLCDCNGTMRLDADKIAGALGLGEPPPVASSLCRRQADDFVGGLDSDAATLVACTQEAALFRELADEAGSSGDIGFANVRELAAWSIEGGAADAKIAALLAMARLPDPEPVSAVTYRSAGATLIVGPLEAALSWAEQLKGRLDVSVLATDTHGSLPPGRDYAIYYGNAIRLSGFLGRFDVEWKQDNPVDVDICTRCNACIKACPEQAIDFSYQIDLVKCRAHRACADACGTVGAIDFSRGSVMRGERFDLVFDLSREPLIRLPHVPQGYLAPGADPFEQAQAARQLVDLVGEFEKPKFFEFKSGLCAHSRNSITGCSRCIEVCSTGAIASDGDKVRIEPHLCMGCGGCATVCPSGAMRYAYPRVPDLGLRIKVALQTYRRAGGEAAVLLLHSEADLPMLLELGRRGDGLPARVIPLQVHNTASVGLDLVLASIAYGASQCVILSRADQPDAYVEATRAQLSLGQTIISALGFAGNHLALISPTDWQALSAALWSLRAAQPVAMPAGFALPAEKRTALEFVIAHLLEHAPIKPDQIALPAGSPWGEVLLDKETCTMCLSCVGACPESALMDTPDLPRLRFLERNCVQCGLCVKTCPEGALALAPRLLLTGDARRERTLNEGEPFDCVRCGKPFGTRRLIDKLTAKLGGHPMFAGGAALRRLQMCADCRVIDMMDCKGDEMTVFDT